jgi:di/tricarboxylate transporter
VALLSAVFFVVMVLTNVLSNNATAILFTPIAVGAAGQAGLTPTFRADGICSQPTPALPPQ